MFRQHIIPPESFIRFFYNFIQTYDINYFSFSKTSRLRDAQGNFILLYWDDKIKIDPYIVEQDKDGAVLLERSGQVGGKLLVHLFLRLDVLAGRR